MTEDPAKLEEMLAFLRSTSGDDLPNHPMRKKWEDGTRNSPDELRDFLAGYSESLRREICKRRIYCLTPDPCSTLMRKKWEDGTRNSPDELRDFLAGYSESLRREICKRRIYCLTPDPCSTLMRSEE